MFKLNKNYIYHTKSGSFEKNPFDPANRNALLEKLRKEWLAKKDFSFFVSGVKQIKHLFFDMDSTLITEESLTVAAEALGVYDKVKEITQTAMSGKMDFAESLRDRLSLFAGVDIAHFRSVAEKLKLTPGVGEFTQQAKQLGCELHIVSGGFKVVASRVAEEIDVSSICCNQFELVNDRLTGKWFGHLVDSNHKAQWLKEQVKDQSSMAFGDGANDIKIFEAADVAVAIDPQDEALVSYADGVVHKQNFQFINQVMDSILCE